MQTDTIPKCINDEFPVEWIESSKDIKKYGFTICNQPPCEIFQFPLMGSTSGNPLKRIYGKQKIFLEKKIKTIENAGFYESTSPWYREWYSFRFKEKTYYIYAVSISFEWIMNKKYIKFYQNFHKAFDGKSNHCSNLISNCGVDLNGDLENE